MRSQRSVSISQSRFSGSWDRRAQGGVVIRRQFFKKLSPCLVGIEACATRHLFIRQQTAVINAIRAHLAEFQASRFAKRPTADLHDLTFARCWRRTE